MSEPTQNLSDDDLRQLMAKHPGDLNSLASRMANVKRRDDAAAARAALPKMESLSSDESARKNDLAKIAAQLRRPLSDDERKAITECGADWLTVNFHELLDAGDLEGALMLAATEGMRRLGFTAWNNQKIDPDPNKWPPQLKSLYGRK